jgi:O-antigen ligase
MPRAAASRLFHAIPAALALTGALYLLVATTSGFNWIDSWHDEQRAAQLVLLGLAAAGSAVFAATGPSGMSLRAVAPVAAVIALGAISAFASGHGSDGLMEVALFALLCVLAVEVARFARSSGPGATRWIARSALFLVAAHGAGAFVRYAAAIETGTALGTEIWLTGFSNPRVASAFYALLIPFATLATVPLVEPDRRLRIVAWIAVGGLWAVASGLQSRALWFSYAVALLTLVLFAPSPLARRLTMTIVLTAVGGALVQWLLPLPGGAAALPPPRDLLSLSARETLWSLAWESALAHPALGIGPGGFARLQSYVGAHPHNWVLQIASEWGTPALLVVLASLFGCWARTRRPAMSDRENGLRSAAVLSVLVGLASALVDGTLVMPTTQVAFAMAFGLLLGTLPGGAGATNSSSSTRPRALRLSLAAAALVCAGWLGLQATSTYREQADERTAFQRRFPGKWAVPRFWEYGLKLSEPSTSAPPG